MDLRKAHSQALMRRSQLRAPVAEAPRGIFTRFVEAAAVRLFRRDDSDDCTDTESSNTCEKPVPTDMTSLTIALLVAIPVVIALGVFIWLYRRNVKKQRAEDNKDHDLDLDYGIDASNLPVKKGKRRSLMFGGEKAQHKNNQLSMDMNLSSPYLLPPGIHGSHDSVHSLAKTFPNEIDPYRPINSYISETGSMRSFDKETGSVIRSRRGSNVTGRSTPGGARIPPRPSFADDEKRDPFENRDPFAKRKAPPPPKVPEPVHQQSRQELDSRGPMAKVEPIVPEIGTVVEADDSSKFELSDTLTPPPKALGRKAVPEQQFELPAGQNDAAIGVASDGSNGFNFERTPEPAGLGLNLDLPQAASPTIDSYMATASHDNYAPEVVDYDASHAPIPVPQIHEGLEVGQPASARDMDAVQSQGGLGVPQQDGRRLSFGMRPLPPEEVTELEDPEYRANRIRSFYKEYFDDSKDVPPMPEQHGDYYEEDDYGYFGDAAYYDADTNAFVMPYAQPVTRRAMTPPPGGRRPPPGRGPRGPPGPPGARGPRGPHGPHGSLQMGRPRAGSAWGPRPGSSASTSYGRKKNLPPPKDLSTLPTPSKLKDDSFAIFNATDFAPPDSFRENVRGRSQSPLGERRAYSPAVPVASPLVTSFDELSVLPSPHSLRKSSTFTGLDFAPPKKFKDADTMSETGSIKSNRSGTSAMHLHAIRSGAGRVSRLPGDAVFSKASQLDQLKPSWNMHRAG